MFLAGEEFADQHDLFDSHGNEAARFNDFVPADEFLKSIQRID